MSPQSADAVTSPHRRPRSWSKPVPTPRSAATPPAVAVPRQSHVCRLDRNGQPVCHPVQRVDAINTFRVFAGRHTLFVQNERYQDPVIIERLVRAARRGVKVHIMARAPHHLKANKLLEGVNGQRILDDVGIKIHRLKHLKLHAKMILADHERAIVGSINLSPGSFDHRRELAIEAT